MRERGREVEPGHRDPERCTKNTRGKIGAEPMKANQADQVCGMTCQEIRNGKPRTVFSFALCKLMTLYIDFCSVSNT